MSRQWGQSTRQLLNNVGDEEVAWEVAGQILEEERCYSFALIWCDKSNKNAPGLEESACGLGD